MDNFSNHYETLNVSPNSDIQEIKRAYRKLAKKFHPDMNDTYGSDEIFKEIQLAYEIIGNTEKRKEYDDIYFNTQQKKEIEVDEVYDNYEFKHKKPSVIKNIFKSFFDWLSFYSFKEIIRTIIFLMILIFPLSTFIKHRDLNQIALYYVGWILFFVFAKALANVLMTLLSLGAIILFFMGEGIAALYCLISIVVIFLLITFFYD